ncbi:ubiquitin-associated domain-containing protein 1 [Echinops telfairi]|uniref:Ubiquitin-associated domain-containing protein 1 n=1 Tax=Echinops telfairi TaxID=9371 RepID=A0AC55D0L8_ECHTE|nr:ubiquitin-associated domain-containing protein 1 [Echinops telfairi]
MGSVVVGVARGRPRPRGQVLGLPVPACSARSSGWSCGEAGRWLACGGSAVSAALRGAGLWLLPQCAQGGLEDPKSVAHHKLLHAASERVLSDSKTISEENVHDKDVLLLIKRRTPAPLPKMTDVSTDEKNKADQTAPDRDAIFRATANLPSHNLDRAAVPTSTRDVSARPGPSYVCAPTLEPHEGHTWWGVAASMCEFGKGFRMLLMSQAQLCGRPAPAPADACVVPTQALVALMEMGFGEKEVMDALRVNNNQQNDACEWLLGDRKPSPEELDKGMDPESPLFQAILDNPVVQLGLTNPKTLLAFEDMLENPLNSTQWMNDPETGPVLLQISRIFQTLNRS